ncbi:MAG: hypothetical protein BMS9Abin22_486 [Gammaproteobacteria bacterium]|nr:MAG: hypothetical protein BMS9Abin22_486 [Gammaproteobacteria bacterium]
MITIKEENDLLKVTVYAELTLADYKEFEAAVTSELESAPKIKLLMDMTNMSGFTVDVAWEEIKFTRAHAHDFQRIAVVTNNQWTSWLSWVSAAFTDAEVRLFGDDDISAADAWVHGG